MLPPPPTSLSLVDSEDGGWGHEGPATVPEHCVYVLQAVMVGNTKPGLSSALPLPTVTSHRILNHLIIKRSPISAQISHVFNVCQRVLIVSRLTTKAPLVHAKLAVLYCTIYRT